MTHHHFAQDLQGRPPSAEPASSREEVPRTFGDGTPRRQACDNSLWSAEAQVSVELGRLEASFEQDVCMRRRAEHALALALGELRRCLALRTELVRTSRLRQRAEAGAVPQRRSKVPGPG